MAAVLLRSARVRAWVAIALAGILAVSILFGLLVFLASVLMRSGPGTTTSPQTPSTSAPAVAPAPGTSPGSAGGDTAAEDELAARPMLSVPPAAARPQPLTDRAAGPPLRIPAPTVPTDTDGESLFPVGFPRTAEGAVAALAAIDTAAFRDLDPDSVRAVHSAATLPGAVPLTQWTPQVGVTAILRAAGQPHGSPEITAQWSLTHAQVKGVLSGGRFVLACVLGELDASYRSVARVGIGDCQRMVWSGGRWWIGPGSQPAYAPSTWPGSLDCVRAGWRDVADA